MLAVRTYGLTNLGLNPTLHEWKEKGNDLNEHAEATP